MRELHITAGVFGLLAGLVAMIAAKGSPLHRRSGQVFVACMLLMTSTAGLAAVLQAKYALVFAALLAFYLVATGTLTLRRNVAQARPLYFAGAVLGLGIAVLGAGFAWGAQHSPGHLIDGQPPQPLLLFTFVAACGTLLDARLLIAGSIGAAHRVARHLWRMSFAMWISTASAFLGQPRMFPEYLRQHEELRAIPVLLVVLFMIYWLARVLVRARRDVRRQIAAHAAA